MTTTQFQELRGNVLNIRHMLAAIVLISLLPLQALAQQSSYHSVKLARDLDVSGVRLGPNETQVNRAWGDVDPAWDLSAIETAVANFDGLDEPAQAVPTPASDARLSSSVGTKTLELRPDSGMVAIRDVRSYADHDGTPVRPEAMAEQLDEVLAALAVDPLQYRMSVKALVSSTKANDVAPSSGQVPEHRAGKLFLRRHFGGIPVAGDKLVLSFVRGNELRKILGQWHRIAYDRSSLTTALTTVEVAERAEAVVLAAVRSWNLRPVEGFPVRVSTRYALAEVDAEQGLYFLKLEARAEVAVTGPSGNHRWSSYVVPLD